MTAKVVTIYQAECDACEWIGNEWGREIEAIEEAHEHNDTTHEVLDVFGVLV